MFELKLFNFATTHRYRYIFEYISRIPIEKWSAHNPNYLFMYLFYHTSRVGSTKKKIEQLYKNKHTKLQIQKFST